MEKAKRVLRYLRSTADLCTQYNQFGDSFAWIVRLGLDTDKEIRRSKSCYMFFVNGGPISWSSRLQKSVLLSSCEAEYVALAEACKEPLHLQQVLNDLGQEQTLPITTYCDNQAAIALQGQYYFGSE